MKLFRILPFASLLLIATATTACVDDDTYSPGRPAHSTKFLHEGITPPGFEAITVDATHAPIVDNDDGFDLGDEVEHAPIDSHTGGIVVGGDVEHAPIDSSAGGFDLGDEVEHAPIGSGSTEEPRAAADEPETGVCACEDQSCVQEHISSSFGCNVCVMYICNDGRMGGCVSCDEEPSDDTTGE
jgi:hypothetical protein